MLALGMALKFYISVAKGLQLKVRKFQGLFPTFVEVTGEKLVVGFFAPSPILNKVYDGTRYLVLFGGEKYDFIYNGIRYLLGVKSGITSGFFIIMQKSKLIHMIFCH